MSYQNSTKLLPKELLEQIQEYVEGKVIYIPKKRDHKKEWGANTDTREYFASRNCQICKEYQCGMTIKQLSEKYFLTEKSIRRILQTNTI